MLEDLNIKDFALIDSDYLEFNKGFTVFSGETGAGKSILIGALSFLIGGKTDISQIRAGKNEASVTATFLLNDFNKVQKDLDENEESLTAAQWLQAHGISYENDRVLLRRYIRNTGKSGAWINDTPVTRNDLSEFASYLIDIHGQHEHQSLLKVSEHRKYLDLRAGITEQVEEYKKYYAELVEKRKKLAEYNSSESERLKKIEMLSFAVDEINGAKLKAGEDQNLEEEESRLLSFEKIYSEADNIDNCFTDENGGLISILKNLRKSSSQIVELDKSTEKLNERVDSIFYELSDLSEEFERYKQNLVFEPDRLKEVQERLSLIYNLKKKYAKSVNAPIQEVIEYGKQAQEFLNENTDGVSLKDKLQEEVKLLENQVLKRAEWISNQRKNCASKLSGEVDDILSTLGMNGTKFYVKINQKPGNEIEQKCGPYGKDDIEFLISANPGNPPLPLVKIASGGELSRVMLALKTIFAQNDSIDTLIFDEIDTGIGGQVAVSVGKHIHQLSKNRQIFCITHLASIAVYADNQIKIEKSVSENVTTSDVHVIEGEERVAEIARMLAGDSNDAQSLEHARSMLNNIRE